MTDLKPATQYVMVELPQGLQPTTISLVRDFAEALAAKLRKAELKYDFSDSWKLDDWEQKCKQDLYLHLEKGDPIDVAAYCAFMWYHRWNTKL
jgi:hypothetical protein